MFFARWSQGGPWNSNGIDGTTRWLRRVWTLVLSDEKLGRPTGDILKALRNKVHSTLKSITDDFENFEFNTIISSLMELYNEMNNAYQNGAYGTAEWQEAIDMYLKMLAPVVPHMSEELWHRLGNTESIHLQKWPKVDESALIQDSITLIVQVNGKLRDRIEVSTDIGEDEAKKLPYPAKMLKGSWKAENQRRLSMSKENWLISSYNQKDWHKIS